MNEDAYLDSYYEDRYEHPGLDPMWDGHWDDGDDEEDCSDTDDFAREDFGWFGEAGLWD